jgi:hypothetical protein
MREQQPPKVQAGGRARRRGPQSGAVLTCSVALLLAACGGGGAPADGGAGAGTATAAAPGAASAPGTVATGPGAGEATGRLVNPTSLNPGGSLRRDTTGAPYDATAADSVERRVAASATGETDPAVTGGASGMELPANVPVSQVGAGPTVTQRDGGGDRYAGGGIGGQRRPAASAFVGRDGRAYYTDAGGRVMSEADVRGRLAYPAAAFGTVPSGASGGGGMISTGSVAAYQPNAPDAPGRPRGTAPRRRPSRARSRGRRRPSAPAPWTATWRGAAPRPRWRPSSRAERWSHRSRRRSATRHARRAPGAR